MKWAVLKKWTPRQGSPRNLGLAVAQTISADWNPNCVWLAVSQLIERQRIRNYIDAAVIFTRADFVKVHIQRLERRGLVR